MTSQTLYFFIPLLLTGCIVFYVWKLRKDGWKRTFGELSGRISVTFVLEIFIPICAVLIAGLGLAVLLGWILDLSFLSSLGAGNVPVAPSTALMFILYATAIFLRTRLPSHPMANWAGVALNSVGALIAALLFVLSWRGIHLDVEHLGLAITHLPGETITGHMSVVTAGCFVLASSSYLALPGSSQKMGRANLAWWSACLLAATGLLLLLAYLFEVPVLYGSSFIPPAALTCVAFMAMGVALMGIALPQTWLIRYKGDLAIRAGYAYLAIFSILAICITTIGYTSYRSFEKQFLVQAQHQLSAIADLKLSGLTNWRNERLANANFIYQNLTFSTLVARYLNDPQDNAARAQIHGWLSNYEAIDQYGWVRLLDSQGAMRLSVPDGIASPEAAITQKIPEALQTRQITFVDFYRSEFDGRIYITMLIPILDEQRSDRVIGLVTLRIDPMVYLFPYINLWPSDSASGETLLVRRDGNDALFLNELRFYKDSALNLRIPLENAKTLAAKAVLGHSGVVEGLDYRGVAVIGDIHAVPASPWFLVARMDSAEVFASLRERLWQTFILMGATIFIAGLGLALVWRQQRENYSRLQAENSETLHESEERFKNAFQYSAIGMALVSPEGKWMQVNSRVCEILGYSEPELLATTFQDITHPDDLNIDMKRVGRLLAGAIQTYTMEKRYFHKEGRLVWVLLAVSLVRDRAGAPQYFISQINDITDRKLAEAERERLVAELESKNKELESIVYIASHDLRSPLVNIQGFGRNLKKYFEQVAELLRSSQSLDDLRVETEPILAERIPRALQFVENGSMKMDMLISGLLRLSRIGRVQLQMGLVDMNSLIQKILDTMAFQIEKTGAKVCIISPLADCHGDKEQLNQVFSNLLDNAIKYRDADRPLEITISCEVSVQNTTYLIADTGRGIAPEHQEKIWEIFHRFDDNATIPGEGLGLTIVRRITERHNGRIWVESKLGVGSCFHVELPLKS